MTQSIMVGMGEIKVVQGVDEILTALGLGSCIGICAYDIRNHIAGMAHVVLPERCSQEDYPPGKFAETAVPALLIAMKARGAAAKNIRIAVAGGAQIFSFSGGASLLDIGNRNIAAVTRELQRHSLTLVARDVGGKCGRTVHLHALDGRVRVKTIGQTERDLVMLGDAPLFSSINSQEY